MQATSVLHSLRLFFIDSFDRGDLLLSAPPQQQQQLQSDDAAPAPATAPADPESAYAAWLRRQYAAYTEALLRLVASPAAPPRTQVAALVAAMECVRGERPGVFNNRLYQRLLGAVAAREGAAPEVLALLQAKYMGEVVALCVGGGACSVWKVEDAMLRGWCR